MTLKKSLRGFHVEEEVRSGTGTPAGKNGRRGSAAGMEENLKKALFEMLVLRLLSERDCPVSEITEAISVRSGGALNIVFPYALLYRLTGYGYIYESGKNIAPDGRKRQYFRITDAGRQYLDELLCVYRRCIGGVERFLAPEEGERGEE